MGIDWLASCEGDDSSINASLTYKSTIEIDTIVIAEYGLSIFHVCDEIMSNERICDHKRSHKRSQIYRHSNSAVSYLLIAQLVERSTVVVEE